MPKITPIKSINQLFRDRIAWHIFFWLAVCIYITFTFKGRSSFGNALHDALLYLPGYIFVVYFVLYLLVPKYLLKQKYVAFIACFLLFLGISIFYIVLIDTVSFLVFEPRNFTVRMLFRALFANLNICGIAVAIKLFKYWTNEREAKLIAEKANLISQLQILKSQVHPHFLFNTLNSIYSLTLHKTKEAPVAILKLSELLRYMLYECNVSEIRLSKEVDMLENYIDLEKFRYGKRLDIAVNFSGNYKNKMIAPLIFLPFVENCFKHGMSEQLETCWMTLDLSVNQNDLYFKLINSFDSAMQLPTKEGIGLKNIEERLKIIYKDNYQLKIIVEEDTYTVSLQIKL